MSSTNLKVGDQKKLNRPTFLHEGIFVIQGITVEVKEISEKGIVVEFLDKEGHPHLLEGLQIDELL